MSDLYAKGGDPGSGDPRYRLAYETALRAVDQQETSLDSVRTRAGLLFGAVAIATSFFAGLGTPRHLAAGQWLAIALFVLAEAILLGLLASRAGWRFSLGAKEVIRDYVEDASPASMADVHRDLALHLDANHERNAGRIDRLWWAFNAACLVFLAEVATWLVVLALR